MTFNYQYRLLYLVLMLSIPAAIIVAAYTSWWYLLASFVWSTIINTVFVQIGLHRYFSHSGFATGPLRHRFLAIGCFLAGGGSAISWSTHHMHHHRYSDSQNDLHSPTEGWWHSAFAWPIQNQSYFENKKHIGVVPKHLVRDHTVMWAHKHYFRFWIVAIIVCGAISWQLLLFGLLFPAAGSLLRGNIMTNTLSHLRLPGSYQNYHDTHDHSYNNRWIQFFQIGEGLHNNHHHNMRNYNQAMKTGEWDPAAWLIDKFFKVSA